jgi:hypothetical protein
MQTNFVKSYEDAQQSANQAAKVQQIIYENDAKNIALRGIRTKTVLYFIMSIIAVLELTAALFFYLSGAFNVPTFPSVAMGASIAIAFHFYTHKVLSDTMASLAFERKHHSKAMRNETITNMVICVVLLFVAALAVVILGRNGFAAYRSNQFEAKQFSVLDSIPSKPSVNVEIFTKNGQLITERANAYAKVKDAENAAKTIENATKTQNNALNERSVTQSNDNERSVTQSVTQPNNGLLTQNNDTVIENSVTQKDDNERSVTQRLDRLTELLERMITAQPSPQIAVNETEKRQIGFQKTCKHCQKQIENAKTARKEYCDDKCRIEYWKNLTGQEIIKGK